MKKQIIINIYILLLLINILFYRAKIINILIIPYIGPLMLISLYINKKFKKQEILILLYLFINGTLSQNMKVFLFVFIIIIFSKIKINLLKICEVYFKVGGLVYLFIISLAKFKIIDTKKYIYSSSVVRNGLGFDNPNTAGIYYFILISCYIFYRWQNLNLIKIFLILTGYIVIYKEVLSRGFLIVGLIQIIMILLIKKLKIKSRKNYNSIPFLFFIMSLLITFLSSKILNSFMTNRPKTWELNMIKSFTNLFKFLFGSFGNGRVAPLDNSILSIFYFYGIITILLLLGIIYFGLNNIEHKYKLRSQLIVFNYFVYSLSEDLIFSNNFGVFIMLVGSYAFRKRKTNLNQNLLFEKSNKKNYKIKI